MLAENLSIYFYNHCRSSVNIIGGVCGLYAHHLSVNMLQVSAHHCSSILVYMFYIYASIYLYNHCRSSVFAAYADAKTPPDEGGVFYLASGSMV